MRLKDHLGAVMCKLYCPMYDSKWCCQGFTEPCLKLLTVPHMCLVNRDCPNTQLAERQMVLYLLLVYASYGSWAAFITGQPLLSTRCRLGQVPWLSVRCTAGTLMWHERRTQNLQISFLPSVHHQIQRSWKRHTVCMSYIKRRNSLRRR